MSSTRKMEYIPGLDLLRFVAAAFVVFYHFGFWIWAGINLPLTYRWPSSIAWVGFCGVEIFFTLSGYVIAYTAVNATARSFVGSRLARLIPGSLLCATLTLITCIAFHAEPLRPLTEEWIRSAFLPLRPPFIDGSYWTLPIELTFYAWVLLLILVKREAWLPRVIGIIGLLSSSVWITVTLSAAIWPSHQLAGKLDPALIAYLLNTRQAFFFTLIPHGCFFAVGVLLWFCLTHRPTVARLTTLYVCIAGGLCETGWHAWFELNIVRNHFPEAVRWTWHPVVPCLLWLVSVGFIVWSVRTNAQFRAFLGPLLPTIRQAGLLTYPVYLVHQRAGYLLIMEWRARFGDNGSFILVVGISCAVSLCIAKYAEPPLRRRIQRFIGGVSAN
jgi:peptidoglycan/LPS O-acetylase OafA/YrhL